MVGTSTHATSDMNYVQLSCLTNSNIHSFFSTFKTFKTATVDLEVTPPPGGCQIMVAQFVGADYFLAQVL